MQSVHPQNAVNWRGLTKEALIELEQRPKSPLRRFYDGFVIFLPFLFGLLALGEYNLLPDLEGNSHTATYNGFVLFLMALWALLLVRHGRTAAGRRVLRHKAPFRSLVFLLLAAYDWLTLKTGLLMLPYFPWVDQVLNAAWEDRAYLFDCAWHSLFLLFSGYFTGAALGLFTGIACGYSRRVDYWVAPFMKLMGAIPSTTWIPVVMVLASSLFKGSVFIIALGVWYSMTLATITGLRVIDRSFYDAARTLGARGGQLITRVALPFALPNILQGLTQGMSSACMALMVAEMIGVESGLGWYVSWQKSWAQYGKMYAAIVLLCLIFVTVNWLLNKIKKRLLRWQEGMVA